MKRRKAKRKWRKTERKRDNERNCKTTITLNTWFVHFFLLDGVCTGSQLLNMSERSFDMELLPMLRAKYVFSMKTLGILLNKGNVSRSRPKLERKAEKVLCNLIGTINQSIDLPCRLSWIMNLCKLSQSDLCLILKIFDHFRFFQRSCI